MAEFSRDYSSNYFDRLAVYEDMKNICRAKIRKIGWDIDLFIIRTGFLRSAFYRIGVKVEFVKHIMDILYEYCIARGSFYKILIDLMMHGVLLFVRCVLTWGRHLEDARYFFVDCRDRVLYWFMHLYCEVKGNAFYYCDFEEMVVRREMRRMMVLLWSKDQRLDKRSRSLFTNSGKCPRDVKPFARYMSGKIYNSDISSDGILLDTYGVQYGYPFDNANEAVVSI